MDKQKLTIGIFIGTTKKNPHKKNIIQHFAKGIKNHNVIISDNVKIDCDIGVMFSYFNPITKIPVDRYNIYKNNNCRWIFIDSDPTISYNSKKMPIYYRVSLDSVYFNEAQFPNYNYDDKRWKKICQEKNIIIKPWRKTGDHILLLLQHDIGFSTKGIKLNKWINETISTIRKYSDRKIIIRYKINSMEYKIIDPINNFTISNPENPIFKDIENAWCAVHYSTTAALPCIMSGIPVFCGNESSIVYEVSNTDLSLIEDPKMPEREDYFNKLGYCLYNIEEFKDGTLWNRFIYIL
jgi:hypothetical protein